MKRLGMSRCCLFMLCLGASLLSFGTAAFTSAAENDSLQGTWIVKSVEANGKPVSFEKEKQEQYTFKGDQLLVENLRGEVKTTLAYKVDEKQTPKHLDLKSENVEEASLGIFEVKGESLKICLLEAGLEGERPKRFATKSGSGLVIVTFKRQNGAAKETKVADVPAKKQPQPAARLGAGAATPQECFENFRRARIKKDQALLAANLTEASLCQMVGQAAYEVERLLLHQTPLASKAQTIREKHDIDGLDITSQMQILASSRKDPGLALLNAGAWVDDPAAFLAEADVLLARSAKDMEEANKGALTLLLRESEKQIAAAKDEQEKKRLQVRAQMMQKRFEDALATAEAQAKAEQSAREALEKAELKEIKEEGDRAKGTLVVAGDSGPVFFRRIAGRWYLSLSEDEEKVERPTKQDRAIARLSFRGSFEVDGFGSEATPVEFRRDKDHYPRDMEDADLQALALLPTIHTVELARCKKVTDAGLAALAKLPELKRLTLTSLNVTAEGLRSLANAKQLAQLELNNLDISDEAIKQLREQLPDCEIAEKYFLDARFEDQWQKQRDKTQYLLVVVIESRGYIPEEEDPQRKLFQPVRPQDDPQRKNLVRALQRLNVQVVREWTEEDDSETWWKDRPWIVKGKFPQFALFAPNSDEPVVLAGDVDAGQLGSKLNELVKNHRAKASPVVRP